MDQHEKNARLFFDLKAFSPDDKEIRFLSASTPASYQQFAARYAATRPDCTISNLNPAEFSKSVKNAETLCVIDSMTELEPQSDLQLKVLKGRSDEGECQLRVQHNALKLNAKQHKKRRNQSEAYHKRIQKKWNKQAAANNQYEPIVLSLSSKINDAIAKLATTFDNAVKSVACRASNPGD